MSRKFSHERIAFKTISEEHRDELRETLKELGRSNIGKNGKFQNFPYVVLGYLANEGTYGTTFENSDNYDLLSKTEQEFLCLAAMTEDENKVYKGELLVAKKDLVMTDLKIAAKEGNFYMVKHDGSFANEQGNQTHYIDGGDFVKEYFRKATLDEIRAFYSEIPMPATEKKSPVDVLPEVYTVHCLNIEQTREVATFIRRKDSHHFGWWKYITKDPYVAEGLRHTDTIKSNHKPTIYAFETWKELSKNVPEKKIIGYRCPIDMFGQKVHAGDIYTRAGATSDFYKHSKLVGDAYKMPREIVEKWDAVYEVKSVDITVGNHNVPITVHPDKVVLGGRKVEINQVRALRAKAHLVMDEKIFDYEVTVDHTVRFIRIGCESQNNLFSIEDLDKVISTAALGQ